MKRSIEPRNAAQLSEPLNRNLIQYALAASAAGVGILALAQPAEAKIVYTKTHKMIHGFRQFVNLDLNKDGITDFRLGVDCWGDCYSAGLKAYPAISSTPNTVRETSINGWAAAYRAGVRIGPKGRQAIPLKRVYGGAVMESGRCISSSNCTKGKFHGNWVDVENRYLGLVFVMNGKTHYGWARLSATVDRKGDERATLTGYAYETIPNKPIITGKTKGPDVVEAVDPGSLGALAAEASGRDRGK